MDTDWKQCLDFSLWTRFATITADFWGGMFESSLRPFKDSGHSQDWPTWYFMACIHAEESLNEKKINFFHE